MKSCALIPIYDQPDRIREVVAGIEPLGLPCLIIDDGSGEPTRVELEKLEAERPWVRVERRPRNGGRGAALKTGYRLARRAGYTHALQVDADGQHDPRDLPAVLAAARAAPDALVLAAPVFDASAPASRRYGRWISRACVWLETLSLEVRDPLCGLRCTPLDPALRLIERVPHGDHMEFDTEIAVRLVWAGVPVVNVPARVRYFADGVSHFDLLRDNARISWLHTRLLLGLLPRAPGLLASRLRGAR